MSTETVMHHLRERATGMRREDEFMREPIGVRVSETDLKAEPRPMQFGLSHEYEIAATVYVRYWANSAEKPQAREVAEAHLACLLYGDVIDELIGIMRAISDGDRRAALRRCSALKGRLTR